MNLPAANGILFVSFEQVHRTRFWGMLPRDQWLSNTGLIYFGFVTESRTTQDYAHVPVAVPPGSIVVLPGVVRSERKCAQNVNGEIQPLMSSRESKK
jgi:hypothetical protein